MKNLSKILLSVFLFWTCTLNLNAQVASRESNLLESKGVMAFRPIDIMTSPQTLMKVWIDDPMPLSFYTPKEKEVQKVINEKTTDGIITYSPLSAEKEWTSIDFEEITPYTWKWIDFELPKPDGTLTKIALRRPHWWIREIGADSVGKKVYLNMPELGSQGWATVKAIRVNQLDTRFWDENRKGDYVSRPITGKFEHESNDVYYLHFGDNPNPLGVTGSHPIWSIDRNDWLGASELRIGEKVKTQDGLTILKSRTKSTEKQKVYNLEIYKDHNFLVSTDKILVHNSCIKGANLNQISKWVSTEPDMQSAKAIADIEKKLLSGDVYIFAEPIKTTTINGTTYILNGHHRVQAAKNVGYGKSINYIDVPANEVHKHSGFQNAQEIVDLFGN